MKKSNVVVAVLLICVVPGAITLSDFSLAFSLPTPEPTPAETPTYMGSLGPFGNFEVTSPLSQVYSNGSLVLAVDGIIFLNNGEKPPVSYSLDGNPQTSVEVQYDSLPYLLTFNATEALSSIDDGNHTLVVYSAFSGNTVNATIKFTVDRTLPTISFLQSIQNSTFRSQSVRLGYTLNKPVTHIIYYLDNQTNVTANASSSLNLSGLSFGKHTVTIYSQDEYGVISQPSTVTFNVETPQIELFSYQPFIVALIFVVAAACLITGLILYRRHRKTKSRNEAV